MRKYFIYLILSYRLFRLGNESLDYMAFYRKAMAKYLDLEKIYFKYSKQIFCPFKAECNIPPSPIANTIHLYLGIKCHSYT